MDSRTHFQNAKKLTTLLDSKWKAFGVSFGIDPFFNVIPGISDLIPAAVSGYLLYVGYRLRVPSSVLIRMGVNIFIDYLFSSIPLLGFFVDAVYRANTKNLALLAPYAGLPEEGTIL